MHFPIDTFFHTVSPIIQSEVNQKEKQQYGMLLLLLLLLLSRFSRVNSV